jgi:hypothetical protein
MVIVLFRQDILLLSYMSKKLVFKVSTFIYGKIRPKVAAVDEREFHIKKNNYIW